MKKFLIFTCVCCICFALGGCSGVTIEEFAKNSISERELCFFTGSTENFAITLGSGLREEPYKIDGIHGELVEYSLLTIIPQSGVETYGAEYTVEVNDSTYEGVFEESPFDHTLASDIGISIRTTDEIYVYIIINNESEIAKLTCLSCSFSISDSTALDLGIEALYDKLKVLSDDLKQSFEGYCKVVCTDKNLGVYFWYVGFVNEVGDRCAVVIEPSSGQIVAEM